jgi:hypothetical protein
MTRSVFILLLSIVMLPVAAAAQKQSFPQSWQGKWKGVLNWYKAGADTAQQVNMELHILPGDSANTWSWKIIYQAAQPDQRPYSLKLKDAAKKHWVIDEHNGIVLDQFLIGGKLCGSFSVGKSIINNCYQLQGDSLLVEFYTMGLTPLNTTGLGTEDSPSVNNYAIYAFQKAVLHKE